MARKTLALIGVLIVMLAACSRSDDGSTATDTDAGGSTTTAAGAEGLDAGAFGDLGTICSDGAAKPVSGQVGIDGTTISLGTLSDVGYQGSPGLNAEFNDIAEAFTKWCNEHGGVQGYTLKADLLDARLTEFQNRIAEACESDFALVGGGAALDSAQKPRLECGLPDFPGFVVTDEAINADLVVPAVPNGAGTWASADFRWLGETFPDSTDAIGTLYGNYATTQTVDARNKEVMDDLGWKVVNSVPYNILGESNWTPFVQGMKDAGVKGVVYVGEPANLAKFLVAAKTLDFKPDWVRIDANGYDANYLKVGGDAVNGTYIRSIFWPFERATENPATQQYLDLLDRYKPGGKVALLGEQGLSAWLLLVTSLNTCIDKGDVSRDCVYATAKGTTEWTGGGLHAVTDPNSERFSDCFTEIAVKGGKFVQPKIDVNEGEIYNCDPKNVFALAATGADVGVKCPSGKAHPLPSECAG